MQRFSISLDDELAQRFDELIASHGYVNRSEAVRDLIRDRLGNAMLGTSQAKWCAATVSFVYDHHEQAVTSRIMDLQHDHHDLVISSLHTHLDHDNCMETVLLRGAAAAVQACAQALIALRGVRHGQIHVVPLGTDTHAHSHSNSGGAGHKHLKPLT